MPTVSHRHRRESRQLDPQLLAWADERLLEFLLLYSTSSRKPSPSGRFGQALLVAVTASLVVYFVLALFAYEVFVLAT